MSRSELFDIKTTGWTTPPNTMGAKWFADSYENAVKFGHALDHGPDDKFYVVGFDIDDDIAKNSHISSPHHDGIGQSRAIDVKDLNKKTDPDYAYQRSQGTTQMQ